MSLQTDDVGGDSDYTFLDDVLSRLYDFGDGPQEKRKKKSLKSKRKKSNEDVEYPSADSGHDAKDGVRECTNSLERNIAVPPVPVPESCKVENTTSAIKRPAQVEIVTFQNPSKKKKTKKTPSLELKLPPTEDKKKVDQKDVGLSLEKARLEVHRFGITGYQKEQQRVFEQDRAIMLGAKPPKREYMNYKVYQQMIKEKKQKAKEEPNLDNKKKKKRESKERGEKRKPSSSSIPTGQVGRFKNGMLVLNSKEIQRIKSSKVIK
ncbi:hypothetical protein ANANG_G00116880 [Anguilla anguilla]|uniref:Uncharacterized protein n=1 Tax=Anguilla anguilla TaxID=7936 RepID=A0A9D3MCS4_ANGAN|nr:hypothetical protein ANANG_G00116880 [Anguilla anguilla]